MRNAYNFTMSHNNTNLNNAKTKYEISIKAVFVTILFVLAAMVITHGRENPPFKWWDESPEA